MHKKCGRDTAGSPDVDGFSMIVVAKADDHSSSCQQCCKEHDTLQHGVAGLQQCDDAVSNASAAKSDDRPVLCSFLLVAAHSRALSVA